MKANIINLAVSDFSTNCYLVYDDHKTGVIVDPGGNSEEILGTVTAHGLTIKAILITHGHCDHVGGAAKVQDTLQVPLYVHNADRPLVEGCVEEAGMFGLDCPKAPRIDGTLDEGRDCLIGGLEFKVLHTPGHTPGGVVLVCGKDAFCGDTIFAASVGRTDFPGGSHQQLLDSIRTKIYALPDDTVLHTGHGPQTSVGYEKKHNPFVRA